MDISVVIPVYKARGFIEKAVESTHGLEEVREIILVEDGSGDGTFEACAMLAERYPKVRLCQHPGGVNRGASASRNLGVERASSEFIAFLDADDAYLPGRFNAERELLSGREDIDGVYGATEARFLTDLGKQRFQSARMSELTTLSAPVAPEELPYVLLGMSSKARGHIHLNALTVRRSVFERIGFFRSDLAYGEDTEWILKLALECRLVPGSIEKAVALRGVHDDNRITDLARFRKHKYRMWMAIFESMSSCGAPADIVEICRLRALSWRTHQEGFITGLLFLLSLRRSHPEMFENTVYVRRAVSGVFGNGRFSGLVSRLMMNRMFRPAPGRRVADDAS
jgi:glycosyltransferase involved in cell wall biosynthesis